MTRVRTAIRITWTALAVTTLIACEGGPAAGAIPGPPDSAETAPVGPLVPQPGDFTSTVTIDAGKTHQAIDGFGASMRIFSDPHLIGESGDISNSLTLDPSQEDAVLDSVYETVGLTRVRAVFQSDGMQPTRESAQRRDWVFADGHIDLVKRAKAKGLREWWVSPLSLEHWMSESDVSDYANWAMSVIRYWKSQGVELTWYSIANEPGPRGMSGAFIRDAVKQVGRQLAAEGMKTRLVIPDDITPAGSAALATIVLEDPEARKYVGAIATHIYSPLSYMESMSAVAKQYNLPLWMSEYSLAAGSPMAWAGIVDRLLADYDVSAIDYMWGFFGDSGAELVAIDASSRRFSRAYLTPAGYAMAQYARYVRPGAVRVNSASSSPDVRVTAFTRNGHVTIVALNEGYDTRSVRVSVSGLSGLRFLNLVRTSGNENLVPVGHVEVVGGAFNIELPGQSISTLIQ